MVKHDLPNGLSLTDTPDAVMMKKVFRLRVAAWRARTAHFPEMVEWRDTWDDMATHWVIHSKGEPVAAARMTRHERWSDLPNAEIFAHLDVSAFPPPLASINRLVVAKSHAGMGLARVLDKARIARAKEWECQFVVGQTTAGQIRHSQLTALGFNELGAASSYRTGPLALAQFDYKGGGGSECNFSHYFNRHLGVAFIRAL